MKKNAMRFLLIGAVLLIFGVFTYYCGLYTRVPSSAGPMINSYEDWLAKNEAFREREARGLMISTIGELLMICGAISFGIAAYINFKPSFKKREFEIHKLVKCPAMYESVTV